MIVQLTTSRTAVLPGNIARRLWRVQNREVVGTAEERRKARQIKEFFFNPSTAPLSWLRMKQEKRLARAAPIRLPYKD